MKKEYKPNYAVHPIETINELLLIQSFGRELAGELETTGITEKNVYLVEAMLKVPRKFLLNLQKSYEETKKRLEEEHQK